MAAKNPGLWAHRKDWDDLGKQTFGVDISGLTPGTQYYYRCYASNSAGSDWADSTEPFKAKSRPNTPSVPSGQTSMSIAGISQTASGIPGNSYTFTTSAIDPDGDQVKIWFNWGDGSPESLIDWVDSGTPVSATHIWNTSGMYYVKAVAADGLSLSNYSNPLAIEIESPNESPDKPLQPAGPTSGIPGTSYSYSTSAIDPDGDQVKYTFDWGDGTNSTTGLFDSGAIASAAHIWNSSGAFQVRAMATDSKGATSDWSSPLNVTINAPPQTPAIPAGQASGIPGTSYIYSTSATDPDGDQIAYTFDWGDGTNSTTALLDSGAIANATHIWNIAGIYVVKAKATDSNGLDSEWSNAINVSIANNSCISGIKFNDTNANGTRDAGEAGLSGWTIKLTRPDGTTINATTDAIGAYKFENLASGTYRVSEVRQVQLDSDLPGMAGRSHNQYH